MPKVIRCGAGLRPSVLLACAMQEGDVVTVPRYQARRALTSAIGASAHSA